ncbi:KPCB kinase, partial [Polypterus senegalus]
MRATIKKDIREAKRQLERNIADKAKEDPKRFFQYFSSKRTVKEEVKFIRNSKGELKDTDNEIADALNLHFSEVFTSEQVDNLPEKNRKDTANFDREFTKQPTELTPTDKLFIMNLDQNEFAGFSYTNPEFVIQV